MPRPEAGERRATAEPVKYRGGSTMSPTSAYGQNAATQAAERRAQAQRQQVMQEANRRQNQLDQQRLRFAQQNEYLRAQQLAAYGGPQQGSPVVYNGPGSAANLYAQQAQANAAQVAGRALGPTGSWTDANYNGPGSAASLYAQQAQATYNKQTGQQWYDLRRQQAAYHATLGQNTMDASKYYFGPGSMEQEYATRAYANSPIGIPTVPVDNTYYGGGYAGYGGGGGGGYVAPEEDIPRWLYGMLNWRYR